MSAGEGLRELAAEIAKDWNGRELDTAWAVAEHALPKGWRLWGLSVELPPDASPLEPMPEGRWEWRAAAMANDWSAEEIAVGATPAAALLTLADRLSAAELANRP